MKVMTFNIQHCLDYMNDKIDIDLFVNAIKEISPDICGLNEVREKARLKATPTRRMRWLTALDITVILQRQSTSAAQVPTAMHS